VADNQVAVAEGAIFATDIRDAFTSLSDPSIWRALALPGQAWARFILGDRSQPDAPQVWIVKLPPGFVVPKHYHKTHRLEIVLEGSYTLGGTSRGPGELTFLSGSKVYGPMVVGAEGVTTLEVFSSGRDMEPVFADALSPITQASLASMGMAPIVDESINAGAK